LKETNILILVISQLTAEEEEAIARVKTYLNKMSNKSGVITVKLPKSSFLAKCPAEVELVIEEAFTRLQSII